jgi:hypothetical protein
MAKARGTFDVELAPLPPDAVEEVKTLGRMSIRKTFQGDVAGSSRGEMLTAATGTAGSAGYVAIELFRGTVGGRTGTFLLQHSGTMNRGAPSLAIAIVPDSGTGDLAGISGTLGIEISQGRHSYVLEHEFADGAGKGSRGGEP